MLSDSTIILNHFAIKDETPNILKCVVCEDPIDITQKNKPNKNTTIHSFAYDGYCHRDCYNYEKYGHPKPNRPYYIRIDKFLHSMKQEQEQHGTKGDNK
jgi:hypothetical protein